MTAVLAVLARTGGGDVPFALLALNASGMDVGFAVATTSSGCTATG